MRRWMMSWLGVLMSKRKNRQAGQAPLIPEITLQQLKKAKRPEPEAFVGTNNPRELRAIHALQMGPRTRETIDRITGASNGPDLIYRLRDKGLVLGCTRVPAIDRDGRRVWYGVYSLSEGDKRRLHQWWAGGAEK